MNRFKHQAVVSLKRGRSRYMPLKGLAWLIVFAIFNGDVGCPAFGQEPNDKPLPNIVIVMADDLGLGDITPTNSNCKIKTPHLQQLADQGMVFMDAHTPSSVCTPTRYGLLTGRYNWRSRLARGVLNGSSKHLIPADRPTLGHLLKSAGYHTAMIGKWHLGWDWAKEKGEDKAKTEIDFSQPVKNGPDINGFDQYYGHCGSLDMAPYVWVDTGMPTSIPTRKEGVTKKESPYGWYRKGPIGDDFVIEKVLPHLFDKSIEYLDQRTAGENKKQPFFLYLPLPAPHTPIVPLPPFKDASGINPYADFVAQVDHHMGQLIAKLEDAGVASNTLLIFTSDNGCSPEGNFELLAEHGHDPSAGFRGHKADIFEGGHRVPMIIRWPNKVTAGSKTNAVACLTDIYTTLESITGQPRQSTGGEDGFDLSPLFLDPSASPRDSLISHSIGGSFAIRRGPWKLCLCHGSGGWSEPREDAAKAKGLPPIQLYHLGNDPAETTNVAEQHPDKINELIALLDEQVRQGRCTPGPSVDNDREVKTNAENLKMPSAIQ